MGIEFDHVEREIERHRRGGKEIGKVTNKLIDLPNCVVAIVCPREFDREGANEFHAKRVGALPSCRCFLEN